MSPIPAQGTTPVFPWPSSKLVRRTRACITAASGTVMEKSLLSLTSQLKVNLGFSAAHQSPGPLPDQRDTCPDPILFVSFQFSNSFRVTRNIEVSDNVSRPVSGTGLPTQSRNSSPKNAYCSGRALKVCAESVSVGLEGPLSQLEFQKIANTYTCIICGED